MEVVLKIYLIDKEIILLMKEPGGTATPGNMTGEELLQLK